MRQQFLAFLQNDLTSFSQQGAVVADSTGGLRLFWGEFSRTKEAQNPIALFAPDFDLQDEYPWFNFEYSLHISDEEKRELSEHLHHQLGEQTGVLEKMQFQGPDSSRFSTPFMEIQRSIGAGEIEKFVPVVFASTRRAFEVGELMVMLTRVLENGSAFPYGLWIPGEGILGLTPEILFYRRGKRLNTMALAGTKRDDGGTSRHDLLNDPKERREHQIVVEDLHHVMNAFGVTTVGPTSVRSFPGLWHLHTPLEARLENQFEFTQAVRAFHPTPALGVAPRSQKHFLQKWRGGEERRRFGAPFGFRNVAQDEDFVLVAIRNVQWSTDQEHGGRTLLGSGCGVVAGSIADREWQELQLKRKSVRGILGLNGEEVVP
jgi:menaquinone-specific isochorismate synthase